MSATHGPAAQGTKFVVWLTDRLPEAYRGLMPYIIDCIEPRLAAKYPTDGRLIETFSQQELQDTFTWLREMLPSHFSRDYLARIKRCFALSDDSNADGDEAWPEELSELTIPKGQSSVRDIGGGQTDEAWPEEFSELRIPSVEQ